jgi:hypothetical protein
MRHHLPYEANLARLDELRAHADAHRRAAAVAPARGLSLLPARARQCLASRRAPSPAGVYSRP